MIFDIGSRRIGMEYPTYFIADIGANHDGSIERAKELIILAKEAGTDAIKFQNFRARKIVSDYGFSHLKDKGSHQTAWEKSVIEVYQNASIPFDWTPELKEFCENNNVDYFSTPYDFEAVDMLEEFVPAYKIGSGDVNWLEFLEYVARKNKPTLIATGASNIGEVQEAVNAVLRHNKQLVLMQCNTNYTGDIGNFNHIHLNVLSTYKGMFPGLVLGLSDHTPGHETVLGAVTLGARVIEKHFTDDTTREGPDHKFAMDAQSWNAMVESTRLLEKALGNQAKFVAENEMDTVVVQRRCLRAARDINRGERITRAMIDVLRPAPHGSIPPSQIDNVIGGTATSSIKAGEELRCHHIK